MKCYQRNKYAAWTSLHYGKHHVAQGSSRRSISVMLLSGRKDAGRVQGRWSATHKHQPEKIWEL